jgi:hypothetical protein
MCCVIAVRPIEDCLHGDFVREFVLDGPLDEAAMRRLSQGATLQFYPDFPRPYFRIQRAGAYIIQGVIGKTTLRATFSQKGAVGMEEVLISQLSQGAEHGSEALTVLSACRWQGGAAGQDAISHEDRYIVGKGEN